MKLEIVGIPVWDIDRARRLYGGLGWRFDADYASDDGYFRVIQFTPPGSGCSVIFGKNVTSAAPGARAPLGWKPRQWQIPPLGGLSGNASINGQLAKARVRIDGASVTPFWRGLPFVPARLARQIAARLPYGLYSFFALRTSGRRGFGVPTKSVTTGKGGYFPRRAEKASAGTGPICNDPSATCEERSSRSGAGDTARDAAHRDYQTCTGGDRPSDRAADQWA